MKIITIIICLLICGREVFANDTIKVESNLFQKDLSNKLILVNKNIDLLNSMFINLKSTIQLDDYYNFEFPVSELEIGVRYIVKSSENIDFILYFTQLPLISISTENEITDHKKVNAQFKMSENNGNVISHGIGIEYRGGWTQTLPKKSFGIEFWKNTIGSITQDITLLGMRYDDDWNLQAMYNEPLRIRSKTNFELWRLIDTLYYQAYENEAINGIRQEYVELFLNGQYKGVYALSERVDRKQLMLKKSINGEIKGELYKGVGWGASTFTSLPYINNNEIWGGFEFKYPDDFIDWTNIYEFVDFVIYEDSSLFYDNYQDRFDIDNAVNYFIFLNLLRATDNTGKNIFIARYNSNEPYFYVPWDLDGSFGIIWNGTKENITNDILTNGFYKRLILDYEVNGFTYKLKHRWNELRNTILTRKNIIKMLNSNFYNLKSNGVYERELLVWPNCDFFDFNNMVYTSVWLKARLAYLDNVFNNPEILLTSCEKLIFENAELKIYPNPASDYFCITNKQNESFFSLLLINSLGQLVYQSNNNLTNCIDISNIDEGIYIVLVKYKNGSILNIKLMINR